MLISRPRAHARRADRYCLVAGAMTAVWLATAVTGAAAQGAVEEPEAPANAAIGPLSGAAKPFPNAGVDPFVRPGQAGRDALVQLGKALFFDQQVGSDGVACASCHYHAGADVRLQNAVFPGVDGRFSPRAGGTGANVTLVPDDFPLHKVIGNDREAVARTTDDTVSSAGTRYGEFVGGDALRPTLRDRCTSGEETIFRFHNLDVRRVEPRNTPTTINSVFFHRLFWDGRANNVFNGVNPFGQRDPNARVLKRTPTGVAAERVSIKKAALA